MLTAADLIAFEDDIAACFNRGEIRSPVHLAGGNEQQLIDIFKRVAPQDWICGGWRMHYHCLLKGLPPDELKAAILAGRSIALCFPSHRIISSAIVGGIMPIALGLAWSIKQSGGAEKVWCFTGDMGWRTGIAHECTQYADGHGLPIQWVLEDNGLSVKTDTKAAWGAARPSRVCGLSYKYKLTREHVGTGKWVSL